MAIVPDSKNWTWVLQQTCPDCSFDAASVDYDEIPSLLRADVESWRVILARPDASVRPNESTWSPLEYAAHVRDVHRIFLTRLGLVLSEDNPTFANWDQDATAVVEKYNSSDPAVVAEELAVAADAAADAFAGVPESRRQRAGLRSDGSRFTVDSLARYYAHDPVHHLWDVRQ
ncbi:DinB family protein [Rhodococcus sp. G-MC3]|uniref:DinB family protein n=1 Tax=Rhodococcus sp. G-MC3 TaxID=3046209 RepID=UPI0024BAA327|nr:DinB family protein [Rhodococcus sp. G-MC3]MDJ0393138.1 DinB family protein [Rhodococcus sp. G-MC3]